MLRDDGRGRGCSTSTELTGSLPQFILFYVRDRKKIFCCEEHHKELDWLEERRGRRRRGKNFEDEGEGEEEEDGLIG